MQAEFFMSALLLTTCASQVCAQDGKGTAPSAGRATAGGATNGVAPVDWSSLSNRTVQLIANVRGVKSDAVLLKASYAPEIGPYEIDLTGTTNFFAEAEALSRELGARFAVVADAGSADGAVRTNRVFRDGAMRQMILTVEGTPLSPTHRKLYVRPQESNRLSPPTGLRIVE